MLTILNDDGEEQFQLKLGQKPDEEQMRECLGYPRYAKATGLELEECMRILGRAHSRETKHSFSNEATEEILLNWGQ